LPPAAIERAAALLSPAAVVLALALAGVGCPQPLCAQTFVRGDVNRDGRVDWGDAAAFSTGFRGVILPDGVPALPCLDAADLNDDGLVLLDETLIAGGGRIPAPSDLELLIEFLFALGPSTVPVEAFPAAPFPRPGADPTRDRLGCARGVEPPGRGSTSYRMLWEGPERVATGDTAVFTLRVSSPAAMQALSFACVVDSTAIEVTGVDVAPDIMSAIDRRALLSSRLFRWKLEPFVGAADTGRRLLRAGVVLADRAGEPIDTPPTRGPTRDFPLLRVHSRIPAGAPPGPRIVISPYEGRYAQDLDKSIGGLTSQIIGNDGFSPIPVDDFSSATIPILNVGEIHFVRADSNGDGLVDLSDAAKTLSFLFLDTNGFLFAPDAADANDSGGLDLSDASYTLNFLFLGGPAPPPPYPGCGEDGTLDVLEGFHLYCAFP
jgi:hypothetical protein